MLSGLEELILFGFAPLTIAALVWPASPEISKGTVAGRIVIPSHPPLPGKAVAVVELVEHRRGEPLNPVVARETIRCDGSASQEFTIRFDPDLIRQTAHYALQARIIADGAVRFETQNLQPAAPSAGEQVTLTLAPTAA